FPYAEARMSMHRVRVRIPAIEIPHHAHAASLRCPHREQDPLDVIDPARIGSHESIGALLLTTTEQVEILGAEMQHRIVGLCTSVASVVTSDLGFCVHHSLWPVRPAQLSIFCDF